MCSFISVGEGACYGGTEWLQTQERDLLEMEMTSNREAKLLDEAAHAHGILCTGYCLILS